MNMLTKQALTKINDLLELDLYNTSKPFPNAVIDNAIEEEFALKVRQQIIDLPADKFDRYENPFEKKLTLRNKQEIDGYLGQMFSFFESKPFVSMLEELVEHPLEIDTNRTYWGVHVFKNGDKLDIHTDAGIHPQTNKRKYVTVGYYLPYNWKFEYGGSLELWEGNSVTSEQPKITKLGSSIFPLFNRMVIFTNTDFGWHGAPEAVSCPEDASRIFITVSYLSGKADEDTVFRLDMKNKFKKARFVGRPNKDSFSKEMEELRLKRADPEACLDVYRIDSKPTM